ncbi:MAG: FAD-binding oxidoreductase [Magnetospiraceae bacterium]
MSGFIDAVKAALGADRISETPEDLAPYLQNTTNFKREVPCAIRPGSIEDVQAVVAAANAHKVPLYPFSQGKNWGLGSKLPVRDGCALLDLSGMAEISNYDDTFGVVTVQPGVSQGQLSQYLLDRNAKFFLDVTGSGAGTSVVGNTLERGVAYNTLRIEQVVSLQVITGRGDFIQTGFAHMGESTIARLSRFGIGPSLEGLFVQSNLGIVVGATVKLKPVPEAQAVFLLSLKEERRLGELFDSLRVLNQRGVVESVVHVGNRRRSEITLPPLVYNYYKGIGQEISRDHANAVVDSQLGGDWSAIGVVMGTPGHVRHCKSEIKKALSGFGGMKFLTPGLLALAKQVLAKAPMPKTRAFFMAVEPLMNLTRGLPSNAALHSTYWTVSTASDDAANPDKGPGGIIFATPIVPMEKQAVDESMARSRKICEEHGFDVAITLNMMHDKTLEGVVSIDFDRADPAAQERAITCMKALNAMYIETGCFPYRMDIGNMGAVVDPDSVHWQLVRDLKQVLDPNHIISPGRYNLV